MRLLLLTLEYCEGTFSGNGTYACSLVRSLLALGHDVRVICGAPPACSRQPDAHVWPLALPSWGRLDRLSSHEVFAQLAGGDAVRAWAQSHAPELTLGVDFSSLGAAKALYLTSSAPPFVYLCWRVFSLTDAGHELLESSAVVSAALTVALSQPDAAYLRRLAPGHTAAVCVVHPPRRAEVAAAALAPSWSARERPLLTCVVRLSAEKEPDRFVALIEALARRGSLARLGLRPALVGRPQDDWGVSLVTRLRAAAPDAEIYADFLSPAAMGSLVFARTRLNVHPPVADAFGMTVLEAAAWGAPSLLHVDGVGAGEVMLLQHRLTLDLTLPPDALASSLEVMLADDAAIEAVAADARVAALAATEEASATALVRKLTSLL